MNATRKESATELSRINHLCSLRRSVLRSSGDSETLINLGRMAKTVRNLPEILGRITKDLDMENDVGHKQEHAREEATAI